MNTNQELELRDASDDALILDYPYRPPAPLNARDVPGPGASCDPTFRDLLARLLPFRSDTAYWRFTRDVVTGNLTLAAGQTAALFTAGIGEASPQFAGSTLDASDTTAMEQGGLTASNSRWLTVGAYVQLEEPYGVAANANPLGARTYLANLRRDDVGYDRVLASAIADSVSGQVTHGTTTACQYTLGALATLGDISSTAKAPLSQGQTPGQFWYFAVPDSSGGSKDSDALRVTLTNNKALTIEQNALNPTSVGFDVIVPVRLVLVGVPYCGQAMNLEAMVEARVKAAVNRALGGMKG